MGVMAEDKIVFKKVNEIKPYVRNPRRNERTVELLCEIIPKVGFNVPLVIDKNGVIVKGHARYFAAIRLGMTELPCIVTHADDEAVKIDRITDNKIAEYSKWMNEELAEELNDINSVIDFSEMGFPTVNFSEMPSEGAQSPSDGFQGDLGINMPKDNKNALRASEKPKRYYKCVCSHCGHVMFVSE